MRKKPANLQELFRRALSSQIDLGMGEVVLGGRPALGPRLPEALATAKKKVIPAGEAIEEFSRNRIGDGDDQQMMISLSQEASYGSLEEHCQAICECQRCALGRTRTKFVYGVGNPHADLMFIGEAPGAEEDRLGEPFVGRAGKLLDRILEAIQMSRDQVYIGNILKCRPPGNRDPQPDEMALCLPYLQEQIRLIEPKLLCLLGRVAAQVLLKTTTPLGKLRGRWFDFQGVPAMVTYHPAALLRFQAYKKDCWADMQMLKARHDELT
ncbi:MAG TPA: uracil-DNA glycosylase [Acidobacteriota bacterium]|nr:uracil-DNA glycosylase [Acidobacteriota bacterium]